MLSISGTEIIQLFKWFFRIKKHKVDQVFLKQKNLFVILKDGQQRQLTFASCDLDYVYSKKKGIIIFIRSKEVECNLAHKLMFFDTSNFKEGLITDQKPQRDGLEGSFELINPKDLTLSPNQKEVFFTIEKYATGSQLVKLNLTSKKLKELFSAEVFEFIPSGKYKGKILVGVRTIKDKGRDVYYEIRDDKGKVLKEFTTYYKYREFRGKVSWNKK